MSKMKRVGFLVPDGVGVKNYLFSNIINQLVENNCEIILLHSLSNGAIEEVKKVHKIKLETHKLVAFKETYYQKFIRESICYARLLRNVSLTKNKTILYNWNPKIKGVKKRLFYNLVVFSAKKMYKNYNKILSREDTFYKSIEKTNKSTVEYLKKLNLDVIFSTHQRSMDAVPIINAAKNLGICTIGAIFSWDNLPKARLTVRTDKYIVWSSYMKEEMKMYYPEINETDIEITGTPQFEFYFKEEYLLNRNTFFNKYNLDEKKKILCFSGDDILTSPFDPQFLEDIMEVITTNNLNIQVLLRRAPVDVSGRFDEISEKFKESLKVASPLWNFDSKNKEKWQVIYPTIEDIKLLVSTVYYSDYVVNLGSTMAHDFSIYNKPCIYLNYNPVKSNNWDVNVIYNFQHFKSMGTLKPIIWLKSKKDILKILKSDFKINNNDNVKWLDKIAENKQTATEKITKLILKCI